MISSLPLGIRKKIAVLFACMIFLSIAGVFWYKAWQYSLPTPVPPGYQPVPNGASIPTIGINTGSKPLFLHFFNPECPCSRFNISQFQELANKYKQKVQFAVVVMSAKPVNAAAIQKKFGFNLPVITDKLLARKCGVYSTPQAVLIGTNNRLYYRGNYNSTRYCTNQATNYAQQAVDGLLNQKKLSFDEMALRAYGCSLPSSNLQ